MVNTYKSKKDFYRVQSHEQLEIFLLNKDREIDRLQDKLFLLSGCGIFGDMDGTNGSCVDCYYGNRNLFDRCNIFQAALRAYLNIQKEN